MRDLEHNSQTLVIEPSSLMNQCSFKALIFKIFWDLFFGICSDLI